MTEQTEAPQIVYVKFEQQDGSLQIARHARPALLSPTEDLNDFVRDIVQHYKTDPQIRYLGLADEDEFAAFENIQHQPAGV